MLDAHSRNHKIQTPKQRWVYILQQQFQQILTASAQNKENSTLNRLPTVTKPIKKCAPIRQLAKSKLPPSRTITSFFKIASTRTYPNVCFLDERGSKLEFPCFDDRLMKIPSQLNHTIYHSLDNDCQTDSEQIESAIKTLHRYVQAAVQEEVDA